MQYKRSLFYAKLNVFKNQISIYLYTKYCEMRTPMQNEYIYCKTQLRLIRFRKKRVFQNSIFTAKVSNFKR